MLPAMKEKLLWSIVVLLGLLLVFAHGQTTPRPESSIGRYQIVVAPESSSEVIQVLKLDTATGKTWLKSLTVENGTKKPVWGVIPDYPDPRPAK
jgi:hypothetical protein